MRQKRGKRRGIPRRLANPSLSADNAPRPSCGAVAQLGERRVRNALCSPPLLIYQALPWAGLPAKCTITHVRAR